MTAKQPKKGPTIQPRPLQDFHNIPKESYREYLERTLTVGEYADLPDLLGISSKRLQYNLGRPTRMDAELIYSIARVVHGHRNQAAFLITEFNLGRQRITLDEAEEMRKQTPEKNRKHEQID